MKPRSRPNPGRVAAARALLAVDAGEHAEEALARLAPADPADRALAWSLVFGVLRRRPELDAAITTVARRAVRNLDPGVLATLRVGTYERRHTRVPPHAATAQAVEVARALSLAHAAGFVNAVMRRVAEVEVPPDARLGHPEWLAARWRARYGAAADAWMAANNQPAPLWIVARDDAAGVARAFQHQGVTAVPHALPGVLRVEGGGPVPELPGFAEGRWWVMDPAAVAVADLVTPLAPGDRVLDACAAPGGKSFRLASRGAAVTATDLDAERLGRVREGAARLGLPMETLVHDWSVGPLDGAWDAVLVDAPCTALGLLRRHPDIRWRRRPEDIPAAALRQRRILAHAARCVRPGGALVYAVCSPEPEEGPEVVATLGWTVEAVHEDAPATDGRDAFWGARLRAPG